MVSRTQPVQPCWELPSWLPCDPCLNLDDFDDQQRLLDAWAVATAFVFRSTGAQWPGACFKETVRPCINRCTCPPSRCSYDRWGNPRSWTWCACGGWNRLDLSEAGLVLPLHDVIQVNVYGGSACPSQGTHTWRESDGAIRLEWVGATPYLVQQSPDGACPMWWPNQDMCRPVGEACTWSVDLRTGIEPPADVVTVAWNLAMEIVKECATTACTLGQGATRVTTRGATFEKDKNQVGNTFWWSMMQEIIKQTTDTKTPRFVESFVAPPSGDVVWHHTTGPVEYHMANCAQGTQSKITVWAFDGSGYIPDTSVGIYIQRPGEPAPEGLAENDLVFRQT